MIFVKTLRIYMKINDYKIGTSIVTTAAQRTNDNGTFYTSFGVNKNYAHAFGVKPEDVVNVKVTIIEEDVLIENKYKDKNYDSNSIDYFALITWQDDNTLEINLISPNIKVYNVCFPYIIDEHLFYDRDITKIDLNTLETKTIHKKGDRHRMTVRLNVERI